jgi:hypothetical protein
MRPRTLLSLAVAFTALALFASCARRPGAPASARAQQPTEAWLLRGRAIVYEGSAETEQSVDGQTSDPTKKWASALVISSPANAAKPDRVLVVRALHPSSDEDEAAGAYTEFTRDGATALSALDTPMELEEALHTLDLHLPLPLEAPAVTGASAEREVLVLNRFPLKATFLASSRPSEAGAVEKVTRHTLELAKDAALVFEIEDARAQLTAWREEIALDDRDGSVRSASRQYAFELEQEGAKVKVSLRYRLEAKEVVESVAAGSQLAQGLKGFADLTADFGKRLPSASYGPKVEALEKLLDGSPYEALALAARTQLGGYTDIFDEEVSGPMLAKLLDKPAPDFTLEALDGKPLSFRKATAGKVTLLAFWGLG